MNEYLIVLAGLSAFAVLTVAVTAVLVARTYASEGEGEGPG